MSPKFVEKPWGYEIWFEVNENYAVKELFLKQGCSCSLQYHDFKHETFYVVKGLLKVTQGENVESLKDSILKPGDICVLPPKIIHRSFAIQDTIFIECSTNHLDDVIRLQDNYGRI